MKHQWNKVEWLLSYTELKAAVLENQYSEKIGSGFILDEAYQENNLSGRYIIKEILVESISTPQGNTEEYERVSYTTYEFKIDTSKTLSLTLINSPRSAMKLGTVLSNITKNRVVFHPFKVDLKEWINIIQSNLKDFSLRRIDIIQVPFSAGINASMTLRGKKNLIASLTNLPSTKKGVITKAEFSFRSDYGLHRANITHQGVSSSKDSYTAELLTPILFESLNKLVN